MLIILTKKFGNSMWIQKPFPRYVFSFQCLLFPGYRQLLPGIFQLEHCPIVVPIGNPVFLTLL